MSSLRPALGASSWLMNSRILACGTGLAPTLRVAGLAGSRVVTWALGVDEPPQAVSARAVTMPVARRVSDLRIGCVPFERGGQHDGGCVGRADAEGGYPLQGWGGG